MTIEFYSDGISLRRLRDTDGPLHVPCLKEHVQIKDRTYRVVKVTTVIETDWTTDPTIVVQLKGL